MVVKLMWPLAFKLANINNVSKIYIFHPVIMEFMDYDASGLAWWHLMAWIIIGVHPLWDISG